MTAIATAPAAATVNRARIAEIKEILKAHRFRAEPGATLTEVSFIRTDEDESSVEYAIISNPERTTLAIKRFDYNAKGRQTQERTVEINCEAGYTKALNLLPR